jgi:hypothetical protein
MSFMFFQSGIVTSDSEDERAFMALNISMTTRMDSDMVEPVRVVTADGANIEQSVVANCGDRVAHLWKWDYRN